MYAGEHGNFNGEAYIVYFMEDSVRFVQSILDDVEMRLGDPTTRMRVMQGEFGHKQGEGEGREVKRRVLEGYVVDCEDEEARRGLPIFLVGKNEAGAESSTSRWVTGHLGHSRRGPLRAPQALSIYPLNGGPDGRQQSASVMLPS